MSAAQTGAKPYYFVPQPSYWPLVGSFALLLLGMGAALWMNSVAAGPFMVTAGFAVLVVMLFGWFGTVIGESEARLYNKKVDASFRWSMSWFIFSEVMFFAAFFGALFYVRNLSVPDLGSLMSKLSGPITPRTGRRWARTSRNRSRRWRRSGSRCSTRSSWCRPASRSRSRTMR